jgi:serine/threonine protein kinase
VTTAFRPGRATGNRTRPVRSIEQHRRWRLALTQDFSSVVGSLAPGDQIAGYQVQEQIGRGGMAVVYRALDLRLQRQVALKVLAPHLGEDEAFRQRFIRESRAAAGVDHPHIIPVFEAGEADGVLFIAMRYVSYGDVRTLMDAEGRLGAARATAITSQVASALDAAHARGLVHRDVKPGNMLLAVTGGSGTDHVYLADFGLSKHSLAASTLTATGQFMGTLDYVSPEQIRGHTADGRADQYALACTAVEMLSGAPPFTRGESMALLWAKLEAPPPALTERRPDLPRAVDTVIRTALARSPADRYPSCIAFATALREACEPGRVSLRSPEPTALAEAMPPAAQPIARRPADADRPRADPVPVTSTQRTPAAPAMPPRVRTDHAVAPPPASRREAPRMGTRSPGPGQVPTGVRPPQPGTRPLQDMQPGPHRPALRKPRRRRGVALTIGVLALAAIAGAGYKVLHHQGPASAPPVTQPSTSPTVTTADPAAVVQAYFAAINAHDYRKAFRLVNGQQGGTYQQFVHGFAGTKTDAVTILSTVGNVVTARLAATQTNGTVKNYQGTYTVAGGVITSSKVFPVS